MEINIHKAGQHAVVIVTHEDGETPRAFTIAEIRDWAMELMDKEENPTPRFSHAEILDKILERLELDTINPI